MTTTTTRKVGVVGGSKPVVQGAYFVSDTGLIAVTVQAATTMMTTTTTTTTTMRRPKGVTTMKTRSKVALLLVRVLARAPVYQAHAWLGGVNPSTARRCTRWCAA